jgi:hypothetical protein
MEINVDFNDTQEFRIYEISNTKFMLGKYFGWKTEDDRIQYPGVFNVCLFTAKRVV